MQNSPDLPFGIYAWFGIKLPLSRRLALIKNAGFHATCLWWRQAEELHGEQRHLMPAIARAAGREADATPEAYLARARRKIEWIANLIHNTTRTTAQSS